MNIYHEIRLCQTSYGDITYITILFIIFYNIEKNVDT